MRLSPALNARAYDESSQYSHSDIVLCLLVYRLAEHRLREQLAATAQTAPN
jgi:hypothetical protein